MIECDIIILWVIRSRIKLRISSGKCMNRLLVAVSMYEVFFPLFAITFDMPVYCALRAALFQCWPAFVPNPLHKFISNLILFVLAYCQLYLSDLNTPFRCNEVYSTIFARNSSFSGVALWYIVTILWACVNLELLCQFPLFLIFALCSPVETKPRAVKWDNITCGSYGF